MKIKPIEIQHTNPSLGPHETITTVTLIVNNATVKAVNEFLKNSKVNNTISLYNYLDAEFSQNTQLLKEVKQKEELNEGSIISNLTFFCENGESITMNDVYRCYNLTNFYPTFTKFMVENGSITNQKNSFI